MFLNFTPRYHKGSENWLFNSFTVSKRFYASAAVNRQAASLCLVFCTDRDDRVCRSDLNLFSIFSPTYSQSDII